MEIETDATMIICVKMEYHRREQKQINMKINNVRTFSSLIEIGISFVYMYKKKIHHNSF